MREQIIGIVLLLFGTLCSSEQKMYFQGNACRSAAVRTALGSAPKTVARLTVCRRANVAQGTEIAQETIDFLKNGEKQLTLDDQYRNLTLMIGNTGTGKSTLVRYVTGDLADLKSVKVGRSGFVIQYKDDGVIGNSTTVSQTIYPSLVIDQAKIAFYDCPGFDDTRNTSVEIAATYYIKKVIDHAQSLKFVLVVNYNDVLSGESRDNFPDLVRNLFTFIKNVTNYRDSISLVATKAPNQNDEDLQHNIAIFLQDYRDEQLKTMETNNFARYAVDLLDILLTSKGNGNDTTFERISVFKKPTKARPLNEIQEMVDGKQNIREMILNRTTYSKKIDADFGYTISATSKLKLKDISNEIYTTIKKNLENIGNETKKSLEGESSNLGNLIELTNRFQSVHEQILAITEDTVNVTAEILVARIINATDNQRIPISHEYLTDIVTQTNYIRFLQDFTTQSITVAPSNYIRSLDECIKYLEANKNWYKFLSDIYIAYSDYDFRRDLTKYNVYDLDDWGIAGKRQDIYINSDNFAKFVKKQSIPSLVQNLKPSNIQLETLNNLLDITLKQQPTVSCEADGTKLVIKGDYVRTSDVNLTVCGDELNELQLFALHTVFIDSDFNITDNITNVVIIATNWIIWGDRKIIMKGSNAENRTSEPPRGGGLSSEKAASGLPGLPGGTTGHFIGLGANFRNAHRFTVNLIGGNGGRAQDGGRGFNVSEAYVKNLPIGSETGEKELKERDYRKIDYLPESKYDSIVTQQITKFMWTNYWYIYNKCNGYGGDGGRGGLAGLHGNAKMFELNDRSMIKFNFQIGLVGQNGTGGPTNATNPNKIKMRYYYTMSSAAPPSGNWREESRAADDTCPTNHSVDGGNVIDMGQPAEPTSYDPSFAINNFQAFLRENQMNPLKRDDLAKVIKLISNNTDILNSYTIKGFVNDLQLLEDQYFRLKDNLDLTFYYRSIADRIERFVGNLNASNITLPRDELKVFNYLYTSALGKYLTLSTTESNLIIDIESYLDLVSDSISKVERKTRVEKIGNNREAYSKEIVAKIGEASSYIDSQILPAIADISQSFDRNLEALVNETIQKRENAEKQRDEYIKQQGKLKTQLIVHSVFGALKFIGTTASLFGPIGLVANGVINGASQIADGFTEDPLVKGVPSVPAGVKKTFDDLQAAYKKSNQDKLKALDEQLENMNRMIIKHPDTLKDIKKEIERIEKRLKEEQAKDRPSHEEVKKINAEMQKAIENGKKIVPKNEKEILEYFEKTEKALNVMQSAFDVYNSVRGDLAKIDEVNNAISKSEANIDALRRYEDEVYSKLWPMIDQMRAAILDMERGLPGKSGAVLAIKQWNIQSLLRDTKFQITKLTKDFEVQDDLLHTFLQLSEAFSTLINIYDRIDSYRDQEKLGDYIAAVTSANMDSIEVKDLELQSALNKLDVIITSNVMLIQFKSASDAFKHTVFPFITVYLKDYRLPSTLQLGDDTTDLVSNATHRIDEIKRRITEYNSTAINGYDSYIFTETFDPLYPASSAFIEWHFDDYRESITDLFREDPKDATMGKRVTFWADIRRGPQVNALKFRNVELLFRADDPVQKKNIQDLLLNVDIILTHMGNSYYRCGAEYYIINSPSQEITYSYQKKPDGSPIRTNTVYDKLQGGNWLLSPYATWTIQLKNKSTDKTVFTKLAPLADRVNLALMGVGNFVENNVPVICGSSLKDYYQVDDTRMVSNILL